MSGKAFNELVKCRMREFRREPSAFVFVLTTPVLIMLALGFGLRDSGPGTLRVGIASQPVAMHPQEHGVLDALGKQEGLELVIKPVAELTEDLRHGRISLVVDLTEESDVVYRFDPSLPGGNEAMLKVDALIQAKAGRTDPVAARREPLQQPHSRYVDFLIPGLIAFSALFTSLFGLGMTLVAFRRDRLFKRFATTPLRFSQLFGSFIVGRYLIFAAELAVIWIAGAAIFGFSVAGSPLLFAAYAVLGVTALGALAALLGSRMTNTGGYNGLVNLLALPLILFSGIYFSRAHLPDWLSSVSAFTPLTAYVDGLRLIALDGAGWEGVWRQAVVLVVYTLVFAVGAAKAFKWY